MIACIKSGITKTTNIANSIPPQSLRSTNIMAASYEGILQDAFIACYK